MRVDETTIALELFQDEKKFGKMRKWTLRLGNRRYPFMKLVLQEQFFPDDTSKLISAKIPAALVKIPAATNFNAGQSYIDHVEDVVKLVEAAK